MSKRYTDRKLPEDQIVHSPLEDVFAMWQCSPEKFRISYANTNFVLCASYPKASIVPKTVTDEDLKKVDTPVVLLKNIYIYHQSACIRIVSTLSAGDLYMPFIPIHV